MMQLEHFPIPGLLTDWVESIWRFESASGLPAAALNMSVANGKAKLLFSTSGWLTARLVGRPDQFIPPDRLHLVGVTTVPVHLLSQGPIRLLGVEFKPGLAGRFLGLPMREFTNAIDPAQEAFGLEARILEDQLTKQPDAAGQVELLTRFLVRHLGHSARAWPLVEYTVRAIIQSEGLLNLSALSRKAGYSHRYVDKQFLALVGTTPKLFARIARFQKAYKQLLSKPTLDQADLYQTYYDQAHYIHEFKSFSGYSPLSYRRERNPFGELFYR